MNEIATVSEDVDITPERMITTWGTPKNRQIGQKLKRYFWKSVLMGIKQLEGGIYYNNKEYLGEMVIWNSQKIRAREELLKATKVTSIAFGKKKEPQT